MKKIKRKVIEAIEYSNNNPTISVTKIGEIFGVDRHSISKYKKESILFKTLYENQSDKQDEYLYYFTEQELDFIKDYLEHPNDSFSEIQKRHIDASIGKRDTLYRWLKILGKNKTGGKSVTYHYDRNKFNKIESEEDAYWLGFITADGCIIENRWLQIQLAEKDKDHIYKFCKYMGLNKQESEQIIKNGFGGAYTKDNPICNIKICSQEIIKNLQNKGITPRKSGKEKPYICSTLELEKAYIRGLIDGDGYIRSTTYGMGIVGSYDICSYVQNYITENIKDISANHIREHGIIYKLELTGRLQTKAILEYLYKDANIYLQRKYDLFLTKYN